MQSLVKYPQNFQVFHATKIDEHVLPHTLSDIHMAPWHPT